MNMNPNDFPSFDDYIEEVKRRQQEGTLISNASQKKQFNEHQLVQSKQAEARTALAREQVLATERGQVETKQPHTQVKGRYYLNCDLNENSAFEGVKEEPDLERLAYIKALRKNLKLT